MIEILSHTGFDLLHVCPVGILVSNTRSDEEDSLIRNLVYQRVQG